MFSLGPPNQTDSVLFELLGFQRIDINLVVIPNHPFNGEVFQHQFPSRQAEKLQLVRFVQQCDDMPCQAFAVTWLD